MILFAGDESRARNRIDGYSMRVSDAGEKCPTDDLIRRWVDNNKQVQTMDPNQHMTRDRIIGGVARTAAQRNIREQLIGGSIDDRFHATVLIGDEHLVLLWSVGQAIGVVDRACGSHGLQ